LTQDILEFSGTLLRAGTLYGALARLEQRGLIEPLAGEGRRKPYTLTSAGASVLQAQLTVQRRVVDVGLGRLMEGWA